MRRREADERRIDEMRDLERRARRDRRRDLLIAFAELFAALALGLFLLGWSMHTPDAVAGRRAFWGALALGNAGMLLALVRAWRRAERRGDV